jgi:hypothetical protein
MQSTFSKINDELEDKITIRINKNLEEFNEYFFT